MTGPEPLTFGTVVVGVDGREGGRDALALAGRLAALAGGDVVAVRVIPYDYYVGRGRGAGTAIVEADARAELVAALAAAGIVGRARVVFDSSPARSLHRIAEAEDAGLVVVGSTHHGRIGRVLAGDDAAATVCAASCPVAVAPPGLAGRERTTIARIGVGFDGRPEAHQALALAAEVARRCGATVTVRSVVAAPPGDEVSDVYDEAWLGRMTAAAAKDMRDTLDNLGAFVSGEVVAGIPVRELARFSESVDLLVVGSRGWGPVRRILLGSTAAHLMREAKCPLLVLPRGAATGEPGERDPGVPTARAGRP